MKFSQNSQTKIKQILKNKKQLTVNIIFSEQSSQYLLSFFTPKHLTSGNILLNKLKNIIEIKKYKMFQIGSSSRYTLSPCTHFTHSRLTKNAEKSSVGLRPLDLQQFTQEFRLQHQPYKQVMELFERYNGCWVNQEKFLQELNKSKNKKIGAQLSPKNLMLTTRNSEMLRSTKSSTGSRSHSKGTSYNQRGKQTTNLSANKHSKKSNLKNSSKIDYFGHPKTSKPQKNIKNPKSKTKTKSKPKPHHLKNHISPQEPNLQLLDHTPMNEYYERSSIKIQSRLKTQTRIKYPERQNEVPILQKMESCLRKWSRIQLKHQEQETNCEGLTEQQMHRLRKIHAIQRQKLKTQIDCLKNRIFQITNSLKRTKDMKQSHISLRIDSGK